MAVGFCVLDLAYGSTTIQLAATIFIYDYTMFADMS